MSYYTKKRAELVRLIEANPPRSIYALAKLAGRNYRRVHDHVHELAAAGAVTLVPGTRHGRRVMLVESVYSARLRRLDDMLAFRRSLR